MKELYAEKKFSSEMLQELGIEVLEFEKENIFNKSLDECASYLIPKNFNNNDTEVKIENKVENIKNNNFEEDVYQRFMNKKTKKSISHVHTKMLYESFANWYKTNEKDENIPSNKEFSKNLRKKYLIHNSVKVGDKVSPGIKNLELC